MRIRPPIYGARLLSLKEVETRQTPPFLSRLKWKNKLRREKYSIVQCEWRQKKIEQDIRKNGQGVKGLEGFTLIEILVAISILAISLVVVLQLFSGALKSSRVSDEYTSAVFYAREKMEELLINDALKTGVREGQFDEVYQWHAEITQMEQTEEAAEKLPFNTFQINLSVSWNESNTSKGKSIQLSTIKLVGKEEADQGELAASGDSKD